MGNCPCITLILVLMYIQQWFSAAKMTEYQIRQVAAGFTALRKPKQIARYLLMEPEELKGLSSEAQYKSFFTPKEEGGQRLIHTPEGKLADIQRQLNHALQCVYYGLRPPVVYGFVLHARSEADPRNIYTHAQQHLGKKWVLSLDIHNFFASITTEQVYQLFRTAPFRMKKKAAGLMADLTTVNGILPTGAPSSPILSNFVALALDRALMKLAAKKGWTYTRFSDDLVFSSDRKFGGKTVPTIKGHVQNQGFSLHPGKQKLQHLHDPPEITGLVLKGDYPDISDTYLTSLETELSLLQQILSGKFPTRITHRLTVYLKRSIQGQINFVGFIRGKQHKSYLKLQKQFAGVMATL